MRTLLILLALLIGAAAHACGPAQLGIVVAPHGDIYMTEGGRWERQFDYALLCVADTVHTRRVPMRWMGEYARADSALNYYADQYATDVLRYFQLEAFDWQNDIRRATEMIAYDDIIPSFEALVLRIRALGNPTVGQMATEWHTIAMRLSWVRTTEQADSLLYRAADRFGMTGVGVLNYIKANVQYMP